MARNRLLFGFAAALVLALQAGCGGEGGGTEACPAGTSECGGSCLALNDEQNCGACGNACAADQLCMTGACETILQFDSLLGTQSVSDRLAGDSCGTQITVSANAVVMGLAVHNNLSAAGNLKFLVFDHTDHANALYVSAPQPVPAGAGWKSSAYFELALVAGKTYDVGAIADQAGTWTYDISVESVGAITSTLDNPNFDGYAAPIVTDHGSADCGIRFDFFEP